VGMRLKTTVSAVTQTKASKNISASSASKMFPRYDGGNGLTISAMASATSVTRMDNRTRRFPRRIRRVLVACAGSSRNRKARA
jgi:hypothetical protein